MGGGMDLMSLLRSVSLYPIPRETVAGCAARHGLNLEAPLADPFEDRAFLLTLADVYRWLAGAPNVSQGGQSFGFTEWERRGLAAEAAWIYRKLGEPSGAESGPYGYKGAQL